MGEPRNLCKWNAATLNSSGRLFTCGRPGRSVSDDGPISNILAEQWAEGLPPAPLLHIVSLLGWKPNHERGKGKSEYSFYQFRAEHEQGQQPSWQEWLASRYGPRFIVHEFPTIDGQPIPPQLLSEAIAKVRQLLSDGQIVVVVDSGGVQRSGKLARALGFCPSHSG